MDRNRVVSAVSRWVDALVVAENLCPFAKQALRAQAVRFVASTATTEAVLLEDLESELQYLVTHASIETTLLIHPCVLQDFFQYNQFLPSAERLLRRLELEGVLQIASFHPDYEFADAASSAAENFSNRSPYPALHLLREESVSRAVASYPNVLQIPQRNIERLNAIGTETLRARWQDCFENE